ncbi:DinB family protein [Deinococcus malanensis]
MVSHEAHHKGQVWMMARMIGIKPPMYVKMG